MAQKIKNNLVEAVMDEMRKFKDLTKEEMEDIAREVASEGVKKLKATSPRGSGSRKGHYADGWAARYIKKGNGKFSFVVYNRKKPGLTHLLEYGHQLENGGRARAFPHIKQVEEWCNEEFERRVRERLS